MILPLFSPSGNRCNMLTNIIRLTTNITNATRDNKNSSLRAIFELQYVHSSNFFTRVFIICFFLVNIVHNNQRLCFNKNVITGTLVDKLSINDL